MWGEKTIQLGIVGLGRVADYQLAALRHVPELKLIAGCDIDESTASKLPPGATHFTRLDQFLKVRELNAVVVSTPNDQHFPVAQAALTAGLDLLLEKPATTSVKEFDALKALALHGNRLFTVAFHAAFGSELTWFCKAYASELRTELGPIMGFRCGFYDEYVKEGQLDPKARSLSGCWTDSGINALSVVARLLDANRLSIEDSTLAAIPQFGCKELQATVHFRFTNDEGYVGRGTIETSWISGLNTKFTRIYFPKKEVLIDHTKQAAVLSQEDGSTFTLASFSKGPPALVQHYIDVFRDFFERLKRHHDNLGLARRLHELLFSPYSDAEGTRIC